MMNASYVVEDRTAPSLVLRVLWFVFVGFWLGGIVTAAAWANHSTPTLPLTAIGRRQTRRTSWA